MKKIKIKLMKNQDIKFDEMEQMLFGDKKTRNYKK